MMQVQLQRRKFSRRPAHLPVRLQIGAVEVGAVLENISPGGAFLAVTLPDCGEVVASIDLPEGRHLHVRAKVRWRRQEPPGVGIEFESFLEDPFGPATSAP
jgi:hypothetical protein